MTAGLEEIFGVRGSVALVTGAASGLGLAFAEALAESGARVTLADIDGDLLGASVKALADRGLQVRGEVVDVTDAAAVQAAVDGIVEADGRLDAVFANAGIGGAVPGFAFEGGQTLDAIRREDLDRVLDVNLHGMLHTIGSAAGVMKGQGSGRIVITSSIAGIQPEPFVDYGYITSKAAIINIVRHAALELAPYGITVNAIAPGPVKNTRIGGGATLEPTEETEAAWARMIPIGRMGTPSELKGVAVLLGSPASSFLTGQTLVVDGGSTLAGPGANR